ncbi:TPA: hypothetical protein MYK43_000663 [Klebsiella pneumoniae]|nr:hypothetical protein [Klebsiella pneumoniae]MCM6006299.1 hypothetical protein [Klebsiella pneumoniae]HBR6875103.1 hypothetical protein [Klebsiella pneumoniae]HCA9720450.1 hypothetical protein [Klebsiella pneumoniae]
MNIKEIGNVFHCDCGFSWHRGKNGNHNCADGLREKVRQLAAENMALKNAITDHSHSVHFCEVCGKDDPCSTDDVCYALKNIPATDRIVAGIKASAIPEGFKLVPEQMYLSDEDIQAICMQCGNGDKKGYGDYEDGILWVGELSNDGEMKYGLNIANANYPEEGSITVFEFDEPLREGADK